ncbi:DegT/DnrJ/EryC1/StrS aminotransferase family protein [Candidatus Woesearchaeota archaeon]|nr:DegT/DnrJ/EryC1/StrS aminotransferase family protein [Candidatus Woesearchaeota archaeon]
MLISQQRITPRISDVMSALLPQSKIENEKLLNKYIPKHHQYWTGSGREALRQILSNLNKQKVGLPAYTCHVVLDTIKRAGKTPVFYDSGVIAEVDEIKKIIKDVDILIVCYNFGFLPKIDKIAELCQKNNVILIEDCAQALGATYKTSQGLQLAGSFGNYAFYSFGISKNIGFCGGLIASNDIKRARKYPVNKLLKVILETMISPVFFNKYLYPLTRKMLSSELNKEQPALDYSCSKLARQVILQQFKRYQQILTQRRKNAEYCLRELKDFNLITPLAACNPSWLYLIVFGSKELQRILLKEGVELGRMKTFQCFDQNCTKSLEAEKKILTLALYQNFAGIKKIVEIIKTGGINILKG